MVAELRRAAMAGNIKTLQDLLADNVDVNKETPEGLTALGGAIKNSSLEAVKLLLNNGAIPRIDDYTSAASNKDIEVIDILSVASIGTVTLATLGFLSTSGEYALFKRIMRDLRADDYDRYCEIIDGILFKYVLNDEYASFEFTDYLISLSAAEKLPLMADFSLSQAIANNVSIDIIQSLIQRGYSASTAGSDGDTVLHKAVYCRGASVGLISLLIDNGADVSALNSKGESAFVLSVGAGLPSDVSDALVNENFLHGRDSKGNTPLMGAVLNKDVGLVRYLVSKGSDIDAKNNSQVTALSFAAVAGDKEILSILIQAKANLNMQSEEGETALSFSIAHGNIECANLLISAGADFELFNITGERAIHLASKNLHVDIVKSLLANGAEADSIAFALGKNALHFSCTQSVSTLRNAEKEDDGIIRLNAKAQLICEMLIKHGANINHRDLNGDTALMGSVSSSLVEVSRYFLSLPEIDLEMNYKSARSVLALAIGVDGGRRSGLAERESTIGRKIREARSEREVCSTSLNVNFDIIPDLLKSGASVNDLGFNVLSAIIEAEDYELFDLIVNSGFDINSQDASGKTALMDLACSGGSEMLDKFMLLNPKVDLRNSKGMTALHYACMRGSDYAVKCLIDAGADKEALSNEGFTPLLSASDSGYFNCVRYLSSENCNIHAASWSGDGAAFCSVKDSSTLKVLSQCGIDFNRQSSNGDTVAHRILDVTNAGFGGADSDHARESFKSLYFLSEIGADFGVKNNAGETPLIRFSLWGGITTLSRIHFNSAPYLDFTKNILSATPEVDDVDDRGYTALMCACENGNDKLVSALLDVGANASICNSFGHDAARMYVKSHTKVAMQFRSILNPLEKWEDGVESFEVFSRLISSGVNLSSADNKGVSTISLLKESVKDEVYSVIECAILKSEDSKNIKVYDDELGL